MFLRFILDRGAPLFGLISLFPVLIIVDILICIKMPGGSIIFKQRRAGQYGRLFTIYKFQSITVARSGDSVSVKEESHITPLGAVLRKCKPDELPGLWNMLVDDMSFIGPRPDVPGYANKLEGKDRRMLLLKPGITGSAGLRYRNEEGLLAKQENPQEYNDKVLFPDKMRLNIEYLDNWPFNNDIEFIICTVLGKDL